ncbi:MAG: bestrophin family protein [Fluviicola sp.]|nr:bestrophin family protein [Fluviicola sp.]
MIKYNPKNWFKLIFAIHKSDTLRIMWKELIYMGLFTVLVAYLEMTFFHETEVLKSLIGVYSLIGFVISLLLVFRTNTAYDRWWEGRKKWGALVNDTRNLAIKLSVLVEQKEERDFFERMIPNFVFAMKEHLRKGVKSEELDLLEGELHILQKEHIPNAISKAIYERVILLKKQGKITEEEFIVLDKNMNALLDNLGACERIKNTPIPFSYSLFLKKFIFIYVTTLPLAFVSEFGYYSALIATFVFYVFVSMEVLAEEIEDPFGMDDNDLPTDDLSIKIKKNISEIFLV